MTANIFSQVFWPPPGFPAKIHQQFCFPWVSRDKPNFPPPPPHVEDPHASGRHADPKVELLLVYPSLKNVPWRQGGVSMNTGKPKTFLDMFLVFFFLIFSSSVSSSSFIPSFLPNRDVTCEEREGERERERERDFYEPLLAAATQTLPFPANQNQPQHFPENPSLQNDGTKIVFAMGFSAARF